MTQTSSPIEHATDNAISLARGALASLGFGWSARQDPHDIEDPYPLGQHPMQHAPSPEEFHR